MPTEPPTARAHRRHARRCGPTTSAARSRRLRLPTGWCSSASSNTGPMAPWPLTPTETPTARAHRRRVRHCGQDRLAIPRSATRRLRTARSTTDFLPPVPGGPPVQGDLYAWVLPPPSTNVYTPANNATVSGTQLLLGAFASSGVTQVQFEVSGGPSNLDHSVIGTANPTNYGWLDKWDTTTVPNGVYSLQSVASYGGEVSGKRPISITVSN